MPFNPWISFHIHMFLCILICLFSNGRLFSYWCETPRTIFNPWISFHIHMFLCILICLFSNGRLFSYWCETPRTIFNPWISFHIHMFLCILICLFSNGCLFSYWYVSLCLKRALRRVSSASCVFLGRSLSGLYRVLYWLKIHSRLQDQREQDKIRHELTCSLRFVHSWAGLNRTWPATNAFQPVNLVSYSYVSLHIDMSLFKWMSLFILMWNATNHFQPDFVVLSQS